MSDSRPPVFVDRDTRNLIYGGNGGCGNDGCEIDSLAPQISKWWPLEIIKQPQVNRLPYAQWKFWLVYKNSNGTHRHVNVCKWHHDYINLLWQEDMALDVQEEEANERWAAQNGGRI